MMRNTKIETFTDTWNPLQGCLHGCRYCYAAGTARRFGGHAGLDYFMCKEGPMETQELHILDEPMRHYMTHAAEPYPFGFDPTFCRYRLGQPAAITRPGNIFVCSTGDLFGSWVPAELIMEVEQAALSAPRHNYFFLTKSPARYNELSPPPANFWRGASIDTKERLRTTLKAKANLRCLSLEPLLERIDLEMYFKETAAMPEWVIAGPESGDSPKRVTMQREWLKEVLAVCNAYGVPLYMKSGAKNGPGAGFTEKLMGEDFTQEYPIQVLANARPKKRKSEGVIV